MLMREEKAVFYQLSFTDPVILNATVIYLLRMKDQIALSYVRKFGCQHINLLVMNVPNSLDLMSSLSKFKTARYSLLSLQIFEA